MIIHQGTLQLHSGDTLLECVQEITREIGQEIPNTGLPTDEVYRLFINKLDKEKNLYIILNHLSLELKQVIKNQREIIPSFSYSSFLPICPL